jgi:hypothetical protein
MNAFLVTAQLILQLFPLIIQTIRLVEEIIPGESQGEKKLAMLREIMEQSFAPLKGVFDTFEDIWPKIENVVNKVVAVWNEIGVLKKS